MHVRHLVAVTLLATACSPRPAAEAPQQTSTTTSVFALSTPAPPVGKRLAALKPRHPAAAVDRCPMAIEPGVALGPVELGYTRADLEALGLPITLVSVPSGSKTPVTFLKVGMIEVELLEDKVIEAWVDDLRKAPDCVTFRGAPVRPSIPREQLEATVGTCTETPGREGGAFERCANGGLYIGHGMGGFLQIRVRPQGDDLDLDNLVARLSDDGSPIALPATTRARVLEQLLDASELAPFWHSSVPGRAPLRIVEHPDFAEKPSFRMFGDPIRWIPENEALPRSAFLRIRRFSATASRLDVEVEYPIEGLRASATFRPNGSEWALDRVVVAER
jgi:hypothetical protein